VTACILDGMMRIAIDPLLRGGNVALARPVVRGGRVDRNRCVTVQV